jgi:hypothetical protein
MSPVLVEEPVAAESAAVCAIEPAERDRRRHERVSVDALEWLKSIRLKFGPSVKVIDLSATGARIESPTPLRPGSTASITIVGRGGLVETTSLRVLRCEVASLNGGLVYRGACIFDRMLTLPEPTRKPKPASSGETTPSITQTFDRADARADEAPASSTAALMDDIDEALNEERSPESMLAMVQSRLAGEDANAAIATADTAVHAPTRPSAPPARPWPAEPQPVGDPALTGGGWNKIVVRYLDGKLLKGFSQDFHPSRAHFHLCQSTDGRTDRPVLVPMPQLKAIFFVRDFEGCSDRVDGTGFSGHVPGRRIEVTFLDGEVMRGATLGYRPDGTGFFITPADRTGNNLRVFVLPGAVRHIRYL